MLKIAGHIHQFTSVNKIVTKILILAIMTWHSNTFCVFDIEGAHSRIQCSFTVTRSVVRHQTQMRVSLSTHNSQ